MGDDTYHLYQIQIDFNLPEPGPGAVLEPANTIVWSFLGLAGLGWTWRRRKQRAAWCAC